MMATVESGVGLMLLKERDPSEAFKTITKNIENAQARDANIAKTDFEFLVCGGAPGIGKTRWGMELFRALQENWTPPHLWTGSSLKPYFIYLFLDFANSIKLDHFDKNLPSSTILGLRIAFTHFVHNKYYMTFDVFRRAANPFLTAFGIGDVIEGIRRNLRIDDHQRLFIFLHLDEFQMIFDFEPSWAAELGNERTGLFKIMMRDLGSLMSYPGRNFVQTFLSGTALQYVMASKEPTLYSFKFVGCPFLSMEAVLDIVEDFCAPYDDTQQWALCRPFLQLLEDTGGLPRALQYVFDACFEPNGAGSFFTNILTLDRELFRIKFNDIAKKLDSKYV